MKTKNSKRAACHKHFDHLKHLIRFYDFDTKIIQRIWHWKMLKSKFHALAFQQTFHSFAFQQTIMRKNAVSLLNQSRQLMTFALLFVVISEKLKWRKSGTVVSFSKLFLWIFEHKSRVITSHFQSNLLENLSFKFSDGYDPIDVATQADFDRMVQLNVKIVEVVIKNWMPKSVQSDVIDPNAKRSSDFNYFF